MKAKLLILVIILISVGCEKCAKRTSELDRLDLCIEKMRQGDVMGTNWYAVAEGLLQDVAAKKNAFERTEDLKSMAFKVLSLELRDWSYDRMDRFLSFVPPFVDHICDSLRCGQCKIEDVYALNVKLIVWHQDQLKSLRPSRMLMPNEKRCFDERYWKWQRCYERTFISLRSCINTIEHRFYIDAREMSAMQAEMIKKDIERHMGRIMRSETDTKKPFDWETEEYKAVKAMMAEP